MSQKGHPYKDLERLKAWKVLEKAVKRLVANGDLEELTARRYIVGYLLRELQESHALAPDVILVNGVRYLADLEPVNRGLGTRDRAGARGIQVEGRGQ